MTRLLAGFIGLLAAAWAASACAAPTIYGPSTANSNAGVTIRTLSVTFDTTHRYAAALLNSTASGVAISSVINTSVTCSETGTTTWSFTATTFNGGNSRMAYAICTPTSATNENVVATWSNQIGTKSFSIVEFDQAGTITVNTNTVTAGQPTITSGTLASSDYYYVADYGLSASTDTYTEDGAYTTLTGATQVAQTTRVRNAYITGVSGASVYTPSNSSAARNWGLMGYQLVVPVAARSGLLLRGAN